MSQQNQRMGRTVDMFHIIAELIDLRSFSNLWYWICLAVMWSSASHWVLGIPYDMVSRAARLGQQEALDLEASVYIQARRYIYISEASGMFLVLFCCFVFTVLGVLGFAYGLEFSQAAFLLLMPMSIVGLITVSAAQTIIAQNLQGEHLYKYLARTRFYIQLLGMACVFVTAIWGMYKNLSIGYF